MSKQEILEVIYILREIKESNLNGYEEIKNLVYELYNKKHN